MAVGSLADQDMEEEEADPSVNYPVVAFLAAFRLNGDEFLLEDGLVFVVVEDDMTFCSN